MIAALILPALAFPVTILVPGDYTTIQPAIDAAGTGDTVLVYAGTWSGPENIDLQFNGVNLVLKSKSGPEVTIIDCQYQGIGLILEQGESNDAVVEGFTITHGQNTYAYGNNAGAINIEDSSPTIKDCILVDNNAAWDGGAICALNSDAQIFDCFIAGNHAPHNGGGISIPYNSNVLVERCVIVNNSDSGYASGILVYSGSAANIINCTIGGNTRGSQGEGITCYGSKMKVVNTVIFDQNEGIQFSTSSLCRVAHCDFYDNDWDFSGTLPVRIGEICQTNLNGDSCDIYNNIYLDPMFLDPQGEDYHLQSFSPCIDAGSPRFPLDPDETVIEIGAYYYEQHFNTSVYANTMTPASSQLMQPFPNPFNSSTRIAYSIPAEGNVRINLYNMQGRLVDTLLDEWKPSGSYEISYSNRNLASGTYFLRMTGVDFTSTQRLVYLK